MFHGPGEKKVGNVIKSVIQNRHSNCEPLTEEKNKGFVIVFIVTGLEYYGKSLQESYTCDICKEI